MGERGGELVAANEPAVVTETLLNTIVMEGGQSNRRLSNSAGTNEGEWSEVFREADDLLDQLIASKDGPRWWWRRFSRYARCKYKPLYPLVVKIVDLACV